MNPNTTHIVTVIQQAEEAHIRLDSNKALQLYQDALQLLHIEIQRAGPSSPAQQQLILQFKEVLVKAEAIKQKSQPPQQQSGTPAAQVDPAANSSQAAAAVQGYQQCKAQARTLAEQAVAADRSGQVATALQLYFQLLEVLNKCHTLETAPEVQGAIMARFQVSSFFLVSGGGDGGAYVCTVRLTSYIVLPITQQGCGQQARPQEPEPALFMGFFVSLPAVRLQSSKQLALHVTVYSLRHQICNVLVCACLQ